jgi:hypothetical protein
LLLLLRIGHALLLARALLAALCACVFLWGLLGNLLVFRELVLLLLADHDLLLELASNLQQLVSQFNRLLSLH